MKQCSVCKQTFFDPGLFPSQRQHVCPPAWEVCIADDSDPAWEQIHASDADAAACTWLERVHQGSGVYDAKRMLVLIRRAGDDRNDSYVTRYEVGMELGTSYTAVRIGTEVV